MRKKRKANAGSGPGAAPKTIGFRFNPEASRVLVDRALRLGVSPHELARNYVFETLCEPTDRADARRALAELQQLVRKLRGDLATTAEALLVVCGKYDAQKAHDWVVKTFG